LGQTRTNENFLSKCYGTNYAVFARHKQLILKKRFPRTHEMTFDLERINSLQLLTKSVVPPLVIFSISALSGLGVWGILGAWSSPLTLPQHYQLFITVAGIISLFTFGISICRVRLGTLRIEVGELKEPIYVRHVRRLDAEDVIKAARR